MSWFSSARAKYEGLVQEYGAIAIVTYFVIFFGTWGAFWYALSAGFEVSGAAGQAGTFWGAYAATKLTQPLRIGATFLLTPLIATARHRVLGPPPSPE